MPALCKSGNKTPCVLRRPHSQAPCPANSTMVAVLQDSLQNAFYGIRPRYLVYVELKEDDDDPNPTRYYLFWGPPLQANKAKLYFIHPKPNAPPGTFPLCGVFATESAFQKFVAQNLPHHSTLRPGKIRHDSLDEKRINVPKFKRMRGGAYVWFPGYWGRTMVCELFEETFKLPWTFKVCYTHTYAHAHTQTGRWMSTHMDV